MKKLLLFYSMFNGIMANGDIDSPIDQLKKQEISPGIIDTYAYNVVEQTVVNIKTLMQSELIEYPKERTFFERLKDGIKEGRWNNRIIGSDSVSLETIPAEVQAEVLKRAALLLLNKINGTDISQEDRTVCSYAFAHIEMEKKALKNLDEIVYKAKTLILR